MQDESNRGQGETPDRTIKTPESRGWISQRQLAALLGKEYRTILKWRGEGRFCYILVGAEIRIYEEEVRYILDFGTREKGSVDSRGALIERKPNA